MKITLRFTFSAVVAALTVFTSMSIFLISYFGSVQSLMQLTDNMTDELAKGIIQKTRTLFDSAEQANAELVFLIQSGILKPKDGEALMKTAATWIAGYEGFTSVDIGVPTGDKFKAERMPDNSISMRSYVRDAKNVHMTWHHANPAYEHDPEFKNTVKNLAKGYDARTRPWWLLAVAKGTIGWTDMYVSGLRKQFVYSCVAPAYDANKKLLAVSSIDINVVTLSEFLATLHILEHGRAFILNDKKQVIALPFKEDADLNQLVRSNPADKENPYELYPLTDIPDNNIRRAVELSLLKRATGENANSFEFAAKDGTSNFCRMVEFPYKEGISFTIGIIVPKDDVMAAVNERSRYILLGIIASTLVALGIGMAVARTMSRSLTILAGEVDKVGQLELASGTHVESRLLEVHIISKAVEGVKKNLRSFKKYVPADLVLHLNAQGKEAVLEGERREITSFFSDIADFTRISEELPAETLVKNLGVYFDGISAVIDRHNGTLDKYIGDSVMAFWGAPTACDDHAALACDAALACQEFLDRLRRQFMQVGQPVLDTRIGIHTGEVIVGNIGSPTRMNYTIVGDNVNLASRLEGLNKMYGTRIIISDACHAKLGGRFATRRLDLVAVKGKAQGVLVRELLGREGSVDAARLSAAARYEHGLDLYLEREWSQAAGVFQEVLSVSDGEDAAAALMIGRCEAYKASPPPDGWSGVCSLTCK